MGKRKVEMKDFLEDFNWHSSIGIDEEIAGHKTFVSRMKNTKKARSMFITAGNSLLIHKSTKALWKLSDDQKSIEPVFDTDVLTGEEVKED